MKLTVDTPFILPKSRVSPEEFWAQHEAEMAAKAPSTLEEPEVDPKAEPKAKKGS